jgi:hypothetical protein
MAKNYSIIQIVKCEIRLLSENSLVFIMKFKFILLISVFARTLRFDVTLFNGQSTRNPKIDSFFDGIHERLRKAIEIYEVASLGKI